MAEILGIGFSHWPGLAVPVEKMTYRLRNMLENPELPERLHHPENWPEPMRKEWGDDEGLTAARVHRDRLVQGFNKVRELLDDFNPDFVVIFGDDQYENFREDVLPPYCVFAYEEMETRPAPGNVWNEPIDQVFRYKGHRQGAKHLATGLLESGFDASYAYKPLHHSLGHAFRNAMFYLDFERTKGWNYPVVPFAINCYGRRVIAQKGGVPKFGQPAGSEVLDPPSASPRRLFQVGATAAQILAKSPWRVAMMASSSWSHAFLTAKNYYLHPDTPADTALYQALVSGDYAKWRDLTLSGIEASGQQEVLNWVCLAGAMEALKLNVVYDDFVTTSIFNSSKCFVVARQPA